MPEQIYLDYNATAPVRPAVIEAVSAALQVSGNPSSVHTAGRGARRIMENARRRVAGLCGTIPANIVFTGGATESNNLALGGLGPDIRIITTTAEHPSVLDAVEAVRVEVDHTGIIKLDQLERELSKHDGQKVLVSIILVNNETGVVQPLEQLVALVKTHGALIHVDAVQAAGKVALAFDHLGLDFMSLSAHKIAGPKGIGALAVNPAHHLIAAIKGGGQEKGRRAGTENVAGAAGFEKAIELLASEEDELDRQCALRDRLEEIVLQRLPDVIVAGCGAERAGHVSCLAASGIKAETQVMAMDLAGFAVSAGSACSSGKVRQSHVLAAMGYPPEIAGSAIRVSLGWGTTAEEMDKFADAYCTFIERQRTAAT